MDKIKLESKKFIGIGVRTSNQGNAAEDIGGLWNRFMLDDIKSKIPNKVSENVYSIYTEYDGDFMQPYTCVLACEVSSLDTIPEGMQSVEASAQTYNTFTDKGDLSQGLVYGIWEKAWKIDLDRRYEVDFEIYDEKAADPANAEVTIYIGVND